MVNAVQLHGDEPASFLLELRRRLPAIRLIRAWRMGDAGLAGFQALLDECQGEKCELAGCLVDARKRLVSTADREKPSHGSDWFKRRTEWPNGRRLILAGGLDANKRCKSSDHWRLGSNT